MGLFREKLARATAANWVAMRFGGHFSSFQRHLSGGRHQPVLEHRCGGPSHARNDGKSGGSAGSTRSHYEQFELTIEERIEDVSAV
jgi:hypothetical protein